jgi:hypothetical protein
MDSRPAVELMNKQLELGNFEFSAFREFWQSTPLQFGVPLLTKRILASRQFQDGRALPDRSVPTAETAVTPQRTAAPVRRSPAPVAVRFTILHHLS